MATKKLDERAGPYEPEESLCMTCMAKPSTHSVHISVDKGTGYDSNRPNLFHLTYSVCGDCAREMVEVKIGATLRAVRSR